MIMKGIGITENKKGKWAKETKIQELVESHERTRKFILLHKTAQLHTALSTQNIIRNILIIFFFMRNNDQHIYYWLIFGFNLYSIIYLVKYFKVNKLLSESADNSK